MKCATILWLTASLLVLCLPAVSIAQELPYKEETFWAITFVRTKPGLTDDYLKNLAGGWRQVNEEGKKEGLILPYKIFSDPAANRDDWDSMLIVKYKNLTALDELERNSKQLRRKCLDQKRSRRRESKNRASCAKSPETRSRGN